MGQRHACPAAACKRAAPLLGACHTARDRHQQQPASRDPPDRPIACRGRQGAYELRAPSQCRAARYCVGRAPLCCTRVPSGHVPVMPHPASSTQHPPQREVVQEERLRVYECHGKCAAATAAAAAAAAAGGGGGPAGGIRRRRRKQMFQKHRSGPMLPCTAIEWLDSATSSCQTNARQRTQDVHLASLRGRQRQQLIALVWIMGDQLRLNGGRCSAAEHCIGRCRAGTGFCELYTHCVSYVPPNLRSYRCNRASCIPVPRPGCPSPTPTPPTADAGLGQPTRSLHQVGAPQVQREHVTT